MRPQDNQKHVGCPRTVNKKEGISMYIINESEREYRFGDSGPKYLMKGPRMNFAVVQFQPGEDFTAHYHNVMEENFFILEGEIKIVVDGVTEKECHVRKTGNGTRKLKYGKQEKK